MLSNATSRADRAPSWLESLLRRPGQSIGMRLIACFAMIVLLMIAADAVAILEFRQIGRAAQRIADVDEASLAVTRVHFEVATFRDSIAELANSHDVGRFAGDTASIRREFLRNVEHAKQMVEGTPDLQQDAHFSSALDVVRGTLLSQLDAGVELASAGEWNLVQLRLANQIPALVRFSSQLVERVDRQVLQGRSRVIQATRQAQRRFLIEAFTAGLLTLLAATALGWHVTRSITSRLSELTRGAGALARGDFHHRVAVGGDDELAILGKAFEDAARRLQQLYEDLRRSEQSLRDVVNTVPAHVWSASADGALEFINGPAHKFAGLPADEFMNWNWERVLHPDDRAGFVAAWRAAVSVGRPMEREVRVRRADGLYRWFLIRNVPLRDEAGNVVRWYGSGTEIEDRRRAEQEITALNDRLMKAQEEERSRIAGELHDGVVQQMTTVNLLLGAAKRQVPPDSGAKATIDESQRILIAMGSEVRQLSHELHPALLRETGLPAALCSYCGEFTKTRGIPVSCEADPGVKDLSRGAALALYRIAQEALGNVAKHAQAKQVQVRLARADGIVRLTISDDGVGFVPRSAGDFGGVGLVNMRERVRKLYGTLELESHPGRGTTIRAEIPFRPA
jgi:PAS domain S-box-containing protein